jgi:hypothetical protein
MTCSIFAALGYRQRLDLARGREADHRRQVREHHLGRARAQVVERDAAAFSDWGGSFGDQ